MDINENIGTFISWRDFSPNLFEVTAFNDSTAENQVENTRFYCSGFTFASPSLDIERHPYTRNFFVKSYKPSDELTIDWREDENLSVWKYHNLWFDMFYDRKTDSFVTTPNGKKRNVEIVFQSFKTKSTLVDNHKFSFYGLIPTSLPQIDGDWSKDSGEPKRQVTYKVDYWDYKSLTSNPLWSTQ